MSTWFITGASRGVGALIASLDISDTDQAQAAMTAALDRFDGIDVLANNAGRGILGAVEEVSDAEARTIFETNVFGLLNVTRAVLPEMRKRRTGHIINFSSIGGFTASVGWGVYNGTEFAVEGISESLALELAPLGIQVTIVGPGYFRTDFLDGSSLHFAETSLADYTGTAGQMRDRAQSASHRQPGDPRAAARLIVELGGQPDAPLRLPLGADAVERIEAKLSSVAASLDQVRQRALSTNFVD